MNNISSNLRTSFERQIENKDSGYLMEAAGEDGYRQCSSDEETVNSDGYLTHKEEEKTPVSAVAIKEEKVLGFSLTIREKKEAKKISQQLTKRSGCSKENASRFALQFIENKKANPRIYSKGTRNQTVSKKGFALKGKHIFIHNKKYIAEGHYKITYTAGLARAQSKKTEKIVHQKGKNPSFTQKIRREVRLQKKFKHPRIVKIYDYSIYGKNREKIAVYSEKCNYSLESRIKENSLSVHQKLTIMKDSASALKYVHHLGYSHNDLKPDNILIKNNRGKLADFGLCKKQGTAYKGFVKIYAPESSTSLVGNDKTDVYQFGLTMWHVFHPNPLKDHLSPQFKYPSLENLFADWPLGTYKERDSALKNLILACLNPNPKDRPSMESIKMSLRSLKKANSAC